MGALAGGTLAGEALVIGVAASLVIGACVAGIDVEAAFGSRANALVPSEFVPVIGGSVSPGP